MLTPAFTSLAVAPSIALCTAVLGLFMAMPLLALGRVRPANVWLGLFVLAISLLSLADYCRETGLYRAHPWLPGLLDWPVACVGAFFYCYVRSLVGLGNGWRQAWHFMPLAMFIALLLGLRLLGRSGASPHTGAMPLFAYAPLLFFQLLAVGYALAVLVRLRHYRRRLRESYSSLQDRDLAWLSVLTGVIVALLAVWFPATQWGGPWLWALIAGRLAILYFVGWYGMRQAGVFLPTARAPVATLAENPRVQQAPASDKYARSGMTDAARQLIGKRLARRIELERDHLDSELKLTDLAARIGTSPQLLSQYLNDVLGMSFFDYTNGLRVAEAQRMMGDPAMARSPLLDLAFAAGFNSRSTFNASFKKASGLAPSIWRKQRVRTSAPIGQDDQARR